MTIETANRLVELRKKNNLSQEELAEKLGVSRQAISKWERSEASPDTDNLIALAEIYGMSLDELIFGEKRSSNDCKNEESAQSDGEEQNHTGTDSVEIGPTGIFVKSKDGDEVNISLRGIHIKTTEDDEDDDEDGEQGHKKSLGIDVPKSHGSIWLDLPYPILCLAAYLAFGFLDIWGGWALSWIIFITIPIYYDLVDAIIKRRISEFSFTIPIAFVYLYVGLYHGIWHPTWLIFFSIPILDPMMRAIDRRIKRKKQAEKAAQDSSI